MWGLGWDDGAVSGPPRLSYTQPVLAEQGPQGCRAGEQRCSCHILVAGEDHRRAEIGGVGR